MFFEKGSKLSAFLLAVLLGLLFPVKGFSSGSGSETEGKRIIEVFIRVDDVFMLESDILPQEIDHFINIAEKHDAHVMLATIPRRLEQVTNYQGMMGEKLKEFARRGHQIVQHGYDHRSPFTQTTSWEFYEPDVEGYTKAEMVEKISRGKFLLEQAIGQEVTAYVGAGYDNNYVMKRDEKRMRDMGFTWITDPEAKEPYIKNGKPYFISIEDFAWALTDSTYEASLNEAKNDFKEAIRTGDIWGFLFHDHFTRKAYNNAITLRWFDELLTWLENRPDLNIEYKTCDEWYSEQAQEKK